MKKRNLPLNSLLYFLFFILLFPLILLLLWSLVSRWPWPSILPPALTLDAWKLFFDPASRSINILFFSIWLSLVVTFLTLCISIPAAKALGLYHFRGKKIFQLAVMAPIIIPTLSVAMGIHVSFIQLGLANTFTGVVLVHLLPCLPYGIRILTNVFEALGDSMEQQARVLGATPTQTFFQITLPLIAPGLISAGSLVFIVSFSQYFLTFLIGGGRVITLPMVMFPYIQSSNRMLASVYSAVFIVTTFSILMIMEKIIKARYRSKGHFYL